jgi:hypothetical protein
MTALDLGGNGVILEDGALALADALSGMGLLTDLNLSGVVLEQAGQVLGPVLSRLPCLARVGLPIDRMFVVDSALGSALVLSLGNLRTLTSLCLSGRDLVAAELPACLASAPLLTTLVLARCKLGPEGGDALAEAARALPSLTHLDVDSNNLGTAGALALLRMEAPPCLVSLSLSSNRIADPPVTASDNPACVLARVPASLTALSVHANELVVVPAALRAHPSLVTFGAHDNKFSFPPQMIVDQGWGEVKAISAARWAELEEDLRGRPARAAAAAAAAAREAEEQRRREVDREAERQRQRVADEEARRQDRIRREREADTARRAALEWERNRVAAEAAEALALQRAGEEARRAAAERERAIAEQAERAAAARAQEAEDRERLEREASEAEERRERARMCRDQLSAALADPLRPPVDLPYEYLAETTFGFSRDRCVGSGTFGDVFRGVDQELGTRFMVKVLPEDAFRREVRALTLAHHPNIVRLVGLSRGPRGERVVVYPLGEFGTLDQVLGDDEDARRLTWPTRVSIALGVAKALAHLHKSRREGPILHRDVKGANVVLGVNKNPLLVDCGLSSVVDWAVDGSADASPKPPGQAPYACPVFQQTGRFSVKSDVYSFGVVLAELLTGALARDTDLASDLAPDPRPGPCPSDIAAGLISLVQSCLAADPASRPDMLALLRALQVLDTAHLSERMPELLAENKALAELAERAKTRADLGPPRTCLLCREESHEGVACTGPEAHFMCSVHLAEYVRLQSASEGHTSRVRGRSLLCIVPTCPSAPLKDHLIAQALAPVEQAFAHFLRLKERAAERAAAAEFELAAATKEALRLRDEAEFHRKAILEDVIPVKCPRCRRNYLTLNEEPGSRDCFALHCYCGCRFCAACLEDAGSRDPHRLFMECQFRAGIPLSGTHAQFEELQRARRKRGVAAYLSKLSPQLSAEVLQRCARDFAGLGIN